MSRRPSSSLGSTVWRPAAAGLGLLVASAWLTPMWLTRPAVADETPASVRRDAPRRAIVAATERLSLPGTVGSLAVCGTKAFPIATAPISTNGPTSPNDPRLPILAAAPHGRGRLVACAHGGYVEQDFGNRPDGSLLERLVRWAAGDPLDDGAATATRVGCVKRHGLVRALRRSGQRCRELPRNWTAADLAELDVLILAGGDFQTRHVGGLDRFVRGGGGLIVADAAWVWNGYRRQAGQTLGADHPPNRLFAPAGILWTEALVRPDAGQTVDLARVPQLSHAAAAFGAIASDPPEQPATREQARRTLEQAITVLPKSDPFLLPRLDRLVEQTDWSDLLAELSDRRGVRSLRSRLVLARATRRWMDADVENATASPLAKWFPGTVDEAARPEKRQVAISPTQPRWQTTGVYAVPGKPVRVRVPQQVLPQGYRLRIGCHRDTLWHKDSWRRPPVVTRTFAIDRTTLRAANAFGGMIYVEVPEGLAGPDWRLEIDGAVPAATFHRGETTSDQWATQLQSAAAPWAEIGSDKLVFTLPLATARQVADPEAVMAYWDTVMDLCADLAQRPKRRASPERFVIDRQISAGYMHAGYPIMAPMNLAGEVTDLALLRRRGNWGVFHEIGHNHQEPEWTYAGMGEVTVNLFSMYVFDSLLPQAEQHRMVSEASIDELVAEYRRTGQRAGPWVNLVPYIQLRDAFGWQAYKDVFAEYRSLADAERPRTDLEKRSQWLVRFSRRVDRNLTPFFESWGIQTSDQARRSIRGLPPWNAPAMRPAGGD